MFIEKYNMLTDTEKENFKRVLSVIFSKTFLVSRMYDRNQGNFKSNSDYRFVDRNLELFEEYLQIGGFRLIKDNHYEVLYIENEFGYNKKKLDKNTTIFLYGLRLKFDEVRENLNLNTDIVVSVADIVKTLLDVGAYSKKPSDVEIKSALSNLSSFNIIQKVDGAFENPETKIIILPSILFVITNEKIKALNEAIQGLEEEEEEKKEEIEVDE